MRSVNECTLVAQNLEFLKVIHHLEAGLFVERGDLGKLFSIDEHKCPDQAGLLLCSESRTVTWELIGSTLALKYLEAFGVVGGSPRRTDGSTIRARLASFDDVWCPLEDVFFQVTVWC